ncbi:hypothetical protein [Actinomadura macrotermitis]|uniref:LppX_LprAFG lipoprotein n=1 Tax=Actinomadura macrotermitis TaxID=2585200 RepID=A0A7K0BS62_9ACTN|nr:hypothetical protein [Actinomadura macrotermitis]MQY03866.1 hypothetical protein [Actinomadura macrotermitis]
MRRVVGVVGAFVLVTGAAGCTGDDKPKRPATAASSAPQAHKATPAAALPDVTLPDRPGPLVDTIARQVRAAGTVHAELVSSSGQGGTKASEKTTAQMWTGVPSPDAQLTIVDESENGGTTEAIISQGTVYTRVNGEEQAPGKPWVRLSRQDAANPEIGPFAKMLTGILDQVDQSLGQISADTGLDMVRRGTFKGAPLEETLDGTRVHRYQGSTPPSALNGADPAVKAMGRLGLKGIAWTLWVDGKGLPRKLETELITPQGMRSFMSAAYRQWGEPVIIKAPPADKVHIMGS